MEYVNALEPLLCITLSICLGVMLGALVVLHQNKKEIEDLGSELDKFRELYFELLNALSKRK
tara:strand:+ start:360 stop:545 length:186 start_codon:yes stop_codon:yes gene_type:complete